MSGIEQNFLETNHGSASTNTRESQAVPIDTNNVHEAKKFNENIGTLYHFTFGGDDIKKNGFESSKRIDKGIGAMGSSLLGTYFFESKEDLDSYMAQESAFINSPANKDKKSSIIKAVLPKDAKILDSFADQNKEWLRVRRQFEDSFFGKPNDTWTRADYEKLRDTMGENGTPKLANNLTRWLREQGYDAVRLYSPYNGNHPEVMVINEALLSIVKDEDKRTEDKFNKKLEDEAEIREIQDYITKLS
jgi:hypothetical protein